MEVDFETVLSIEQASRLLYEDKIHYTFLPEKLQILPQLAKIALQRGMSISLVHRKLLRSIEFYNDNRDFIERDNSWTTVYFYLPCEFHKMESFMVDAILQCDNVQSVIGSVQLMQQVLRT